MVTVRKRRKRTDRGIVDQIRERALQGWMPKRIHQELETDVQKDGKFESRTLPDIRTVRRIAAEFNQGGGPPYHAATDDPNHGDGGHHLSIEDNSDWSVADHVGNGADEILRTLRELHTRSGRTKVAFVKSEAEGLLKIIRAAPTLPLWAAWLVARLYHTYEVKGTNSQSIWP